MAKAQRDHHDAVGDDPDDEYRQLLADVVSKCLEH